MSETTAVDCSIFRKSFDNADDMFYITDRNAKILYVNSSFERISGYSFTEAFMKTPRLFKSGAMSRDYYDELWEHILSGGIWREEIINKRKDGSLYTAYQSITPLKDHAGHIIHFSVILRDITKEKKLLERIQTARYESELILNNTSDAIFMMDVTDKDIFLYNRLNRRHEELTGLTTEIVQGKTPCQFLGDEVGRVVAKNYRRCLERRKEYTYDEYLELPGGGRWWQTRLTPVFSGDRITRIVGISRDITREKQERKELEDFFDLNLDLLCIADTAGQFVKLSASWEDILGYTRKELAGQEYLQFVHPDDLEYTIEAMEKLRDGRKLVNFVNRYRKKNGTYIYIEWRSQPRGDLVFAAARNITERIRRERELTHAREELMRKTQLQSFLMDIARTYINIPVDDMNDAVTAGMARICRFFAYFRAYVFLIDHAEDLCRLTYEWCEEEYPPHTNDIRTIPLADIPEVVDALHLETPFELSGVYEEGENSFIKLKKESSVHSIIIAPLIKDRGIIGFMGFDSDDSETDLQEYERDILFFYAQITTNIIQRREMEENLYRLSTTDPLLGLLNRNRFTEILDHEIHRSSRYGSPLALIMFDVDHFKKINDTFGHDRGDEVLKTVGQSVQNIMRKTDTLCRWGGEEFMVLCSETDEEGVRVFAERIRKVVAEKTAEKSTPATISLGLSIFHRTDKREDILKRVDTALYDAKEQGRNRTCFR
ncbi:MAG: sensor domain-containing diguanylate cyclase [Fibrobacterota bacterium]